MEVQERGRTGHPLPPLLSLCPQRIVFCITIHLMSKVLIPRSLPLLVNSIQETCIKPPCPKGHPDIFVKLKCVQISPLLVRVQAAEPSSTNPYTNNEQSIHKRLVMKKLKVFYAIIIP